MRKYILFAGDDYYPSGAMGDYMGAYTTIQDAKDAFEKTNNDWAEIAIYDGEGLRLVAQYDIWERGKGRVWRMMDAQEQP